MKISQRLKTEHAFSATLVVIVLLILPLWGSVAMLVGSAVGLVAYTVLFRERLRSGGWIKLKTVVAVALAAAVSAAIAVAVSQGHWR